MILCSYMRHDKRDRGKVIEILGGLPLEFSPGHGHELLHGAFHLAGVGGDLTEPAPSIGLEQENKI